MKVFTQNLSNENVTLTAYLPEPSAEMPNMNIRRAVLVIPGGAYRMCSDREAEPIALSFLAKGYAAFVLIYSLNENALFPNPLNDAEEALMIIRKNADDWHINRDQIAAIGFSAGGHLTAAVSTMGKERPNAQILGYPCILSEIDPILPHHIPGVNAEVDDLTPPAFIFHACEDTAVPIRHSLRYADALERHNIPFEMHIYQKGNHGFSLANDVVYSGKDSLEYNKHCSTWFDQCITWLDNLFN